MRHLNGFERAGLALLLVLTLLTGCAPRENTSQSTRENREITDMAGRQVTVPVQIDSVFPTGPNSAIYLYTLAPDRLLGWNYPLNDQEKSILPEQYHTLPVYGMGDAVSYEAVIAAAPSLVLNTGTINDKLISDCDKLSRQLGIPVVAVDGDLMASPQAYRFLGELLGAQEQGELLAGYAERTLQDIAGLNIPEEERVRVYYGNGEDSLETAPAGSSHAQIIELAGAANAAELELGDGARIRISPEQLLAWDPDVILTVGEPTSNMSGSSAAEALRSDPVFASLSAVQAGRVYGVPNAPFGWVDRPPGPNRIIGLRWLSGLLYPDRLNFDVDEEVRQFFHLFYHVQLTSQQLEQLYSGAL